MATRESVTVTEGGVDDDATAVLQGAIDDCADAGGGTVRVLAGEYRIRPIVLRSDVTLHLEAGATLEASTDPDHYGDTPGPIDALIVASEAERVSITGRGTIDGNSAAFVHENEVQALNDGGRRTRQGTDYLDPATLPPDSEAPLKPRERPGNLLLFDRCTDVHLDGVTIRDSPSWTVHLLACTDVTVTGIDVRNDLRVPNNDGIVPNKSRNVSISDCSIHTGDDGITLKTTEAGDVTRSTENVTVTNCTIVSRSCAIIIGGETYHGVSNCTFGNCVIRESSRGLGIRLLDEGSVENVLFSDVVVETRLHRGRWWGQAEPIYVLAAPRSASTDVGEVRNVRFSNVLATAEQGAVLWGSEGSLLRNVTLDGVELRLREGEHSDAVGGNVDLRWITSDPPATEPQLPGIFERDVPGLYAGHVRDLDLRDVTVQWDEDPPSYFSHGVECEQFSGLRIDAFRGRGATADGVLTTGDTRAAIALSNGDGVSVRDSTAAPGTAVFLRLDGTGDERVFADNDLRDAETAIDGRTGEFEGLDGGR